MSSELDIKKDKPTAEYKQSTLTWLNENKLILTVLFVFFGLADLHFYFEPFGVNIVNYLDWDEVLFSFLGTITRHSFGVSWTMLFLSTFVFIQLGVQKKLGIKGWKGFENPKDWQIYFLGAIVGIPAFHLVLATKFKVFIIPTATYLVLIPLLGIASIFFVNKLKEDRLNQFNKSIISWVIVFSYSSFFCFFSSLQKSLDVKSGDEKIALLSNEIFYAVDQKIYCTKDTMSVKPTYIFVGGTKGYSFYFNNIEKETKVLNKATGQVETIILQE